MSSYECTIAFHPDLGESGVQEEVARLSEIISGNGGKVKQVADWGQRELAYPIRKERRGIFQIVIFDGNGETVAELQRNMRISEQILRFATLKIDPDRAPLDLGRSRKGADEQDEPVQAEGGDGVEAPESEPAGATEGDAPA